MNQSGVVSESTAVVAVIVLFIIVAGLIDYFQTKTFRKINQKIAADPNYLNSGDNRDLFRQVLYQVKYMGPFSFMEMRKLKKSLDKVIS